MCITPAGRVLAFFDASTADGSLAGEGPGKSEKGRLKAVRNMIVAATHAGGLGACSSLPQALRRTDETQPPPDFVSGKAAPELARQLEEGRAELGCNAIACGLGFELVSAVLLLMWIGQWRRQGRRRARPS